MITRGSNRRDVLCFIFFLLFLPNLENKRINLHVYVGILLLVFFVNGVANHGQRATAVDKV